VPADVAGRLLRRRHDSILRRSHPSGLTRGMASNRLRAATASDPHLIPPALADLAVGIPLLLHRAGLEPCSGPGGRCSAGSRQARVNQALRVMGLGEAPQFRHYPEVLDRARWDARAVARQLLYVLDRLLPNGPVVIVIDDTVERRGIYRDIVRSAKGHFVKTSGLRRCRS
jgi:hypothetical protein